MLVLYQKNSRFTVILKVIIELATILSNCLPHVRIDFYNIDGKIYFGEFTFFHHGGLEPFHPQKWDTIFGDWLLLPNKTLQ